MALGRRSFLKILGGGTVVAAGAGAGFLGTRTPHDALVPWGLAGSYDDARMNALSFALLAPNPHNIQPWQVALEGSQGLRIYHDKTRRLPQTDPFDRQIIIGFGCFIEQMVLAAGAAGQRVAVSVYPDGPDGAIAHAQFSQGGTADPLAAHIPNRRSCKQAFGDQRVSHATATALSEFADIHIEPQMVADLKALTWGAWLTETKTPRTMRESVDLMRFGKAEINANPDGINLGGAFLESLMVAGVLTRDAQNNPSSRGFKEGIEIYRTIMDATPAYVSLTTTSNTPNDHIDAGRRWLRLNLATTAMGLSLHPVSQALQEYPEMAPHYARAQGLLAPTGETVQMLGRLGYGPDVPRTPRWPLEAKLRDS